MADQKPMPAVTESIPTVEGAISALASANAPFIYFDAAPNFGVNEGVVNVTLEAARHMSLGDRVTFDRIIVAHLRMTLAGAERLRDGLNKALAMAAPPKEPSEVN